MCGLLVVKLKTQTMLELKMIQSTLLEKANALDAELKQPTVYTKPLERAHAIGKLSGMLDAIEVIQERLKAIEVSNSINELLK